MTEPAGTVPSSDLPRGLGLVQATATNIISMVGVGPFLTIPFMVAAMNGPHVIYAWMAGLVLALADGLVYAQLGAALPGSGGGYLYMREAFKPFGLGGLMGFLDSQSGAIDDATLRRAMTYGSTLASFWVEQFGCERAESLTREVIDERYEQFKRITSIEWVPAT